MQNPSGIQTTTVELENIQSIVLDQNVPNPFAESTVIGYFIPENIKMAQIIFTENNGRVLRTVDINASGNGMIKVYASNLSSGIYTYSLLVDGKLVESKKMICSKNGANK
jgi:trimeric autotransporter adhesin